MKLKNQRMYELFGKDPDRHCGECGNFVRIRYRDMNLQKCSRYGLTHSAASDWAQSWPACGKFNVPLPEGERSVIELRKTRSVDYGPIDGQIGLEG